MEMCQNHVYVPIAIFLVLGFLGNSELKSKCLPRWFSLFGLRTLLSKWLTWCKCFVEHVSRQSDTFLQEEFYWFLHVASLQNIPSGLPSAPPSWGLGVAALQEDVFLSILCLVWISVFIMPLCLLSEALQIITTDILLTLKLKKVSIMGR